MVRNRRFLALTVALAAFGALSGANAQPAAVGRTLQLNNTAFISVDYSDRGYYGYRKDYYGDGLFGFFQIPGALIGGLAELLSGAPGHPYYEDSYDSQPPYASPYSGGPHGGAYYGGSYDYSLYNGGSYYSGPRYAGRGYYYDHRNYDGRQYFSAPRYDGDYGNYEDRTHFSDHSYEAARRYYGDAYYANRYDSGPRYAEPYDRGRSSYDLDDDDD